MIHEYYLTAKGFLVENWYSNIGKMTQIYAPHEIHEAAEILEERLTRGSKVRFIPPDIDFQEEVLNEL